MSIQKRSILLVVPPFHSITRPALGVSQLKAKAKEQGFDAEILYLNLRFSERIGPYIDQLICNGTTDVMLGEFIFSCLLFDRSKKDIEKYVEEVLVGSDAGNQLAKMLPNESLCEALQRFVHEASIFCQKDAIEEILAREPWMVGFSSTFQQNCVSLQLIRLIKKKRPDILTVMGGANCESVMGEELFERFPEIDFICQGESDHSFVDLIGSLWNGGNKQTIPGILYRDKYPRHLSYLPLQSEDLDRLPYPDFSDFFTQLSTVDFKDYIIPGLVMETSRGCWWGTKCQCSFCGMNGEGIGYRSKSPQRVIEEMDALAKQYGVARIFLTDNILDSKYFKTILPKLFNHQIAEIFCETKATLTRKQVEILANSNIKWIQPGIESLSNQTLKLMRKGTNVLKNIELLKWCAEYGIRVTWNHLFGVPGEDEEEISNIALIAEEIHHLEPPSAVGIIDLVRFSSYFMSPEKYGLEPNYPIKPYHYIYPFPDESLKRLAYFYEAEYFVKKSKSDAYKTLKKIASAWKRAYFRSHLLALPRKKSLIIIDTRTCSQRYWHRLTGMSRKMYEYCGKSRSISEIFAALGTEVNYNEIQLILQSLVHSKLMLSMNERYLSIATYPRKNYKKFTAIFPGGEFKEQQFFQQLLRYCLGVISLRISPVDIFNAFLWKTSKVWKKFIRIVFSKAIFFLTNLLYKNRSTIEM